MKQNKQTAVEWVEEIAMNGFITPEDFEQAKEMEKQQIKNAWIDGRFDWGKHFDEAEQYYNETYETKKD